MAIVVLVLWMFTAGAGFFLLVTSNLGRSRPAEPGSRRAGDERAVRAQASARGEPLRPLAGDSVEPGRRRASDGAAGRAQRGSGGPVFSGVAKVRGRDLLVHERIAERRRGAEPGAHQRTALSDEAAGSNELSWPVGTSNFRFFPPGVPK